MGYSAVFLIYLGKETRGQEKGNDGELGKTGAVVVNLVKEYKHKGYKLYIDNFYTSVPLLSYLFQVGIGACGTIRANQKYYPIVALKEEAKCQKLEHGQFVYASHGCLLAILWIDRKEVNITCYLPFTTQFLAHQLQKSKKLKELKGIRNFKSLVCLPFHNTTKEWEGLI